jgi:hypothetical protein
MSHQRDAVWLGFELTEAVEGPSWASYTALTTVTDVSAESTVDPNVVHLTWVNPDGQLSGATVDVHTYGYNVRATRPVVRLAGCGNGH